MSKIFYKLFFDLIHLNNELLLNSKWKKKGFYFSKRRVEGQHNCFILLAILTMLCTTACQNNTAFKDKVLEISSEERAIHCTLITMKKNINLEWDNMNKILDESLPQTMPDKEKENMLKVRNASLIRMFDSYNSVSEEAKSKLKELEMKDSEMAKEINVLKEKLLLVETKRMKLFNNILETKGESATTIYKKLYQKSVLKKCN